MLHGNILFQGEVLVGVTNEAPFVALGAFITPQFALSKDREVYLSAQLQWHQGEIFRLRKV